MRQSKRRSEAVSDNIYLASLEAMRKTMDEKLIPMRKNYVYHLEKTGGYSWLFLTIGRSLFDFKGYSDVKPSDVGAIQLKASTAIMTYLGMGAYGSAASMFNLDWTSLVTWIFPVLWFLYRVRANIKRMTSIGDSYFNITAYKNFNKAEFELFAPFLQNKEFSYDGLFLFLKDELLVNATRRGEEITEIRQAFEENAEELMEKLQELSTYQEENEQLNVIIDSLAKLSRQTLSVYKYAIGELFRLRKEDGLFNPYDLRICSDFSLFELKGDVLVRLYEQGNSTTPRSIPINEPRFRNWAAVRVVKNNSFPAREGSLTHIVSLARDVPSCIASTSIMNRMSSAA
jgi:hypothetical protein